MSNFNADEFEKVLVIFKVLAVLKIFDKNTQNFGMERRNGEKMVYEFHQISVIVVIN